VKGWRNATDVDGIKDDACGKREKSVYAVGRN